jgi:hypothetical protein
MVLACETVEPHRRYLEASALPLDPDLPETVAAVAAQLGDPRVILVGEEHGVAANQRIELALFEELVRNHGVSVYLAESAYSFAAFVQHYIETGDRSLLRQLMTRLEGTNAGVAEHRGFLIGLHELYQNLPPQKRFRYVGIDIEHMDAIAVSYLRWKLREAGTQLQTSDTGTVTRLHRRLADWLSDGRIERMGLPAVAGAILAEVSQTGAAFDSLFQDRAYGVRIVLRNIVAKSQRNSAETPRARKQRRDAAIYRTFREVDVWLVEESARAAHASGPRYFGQWGAAHVYQRPVHGIDWFASRLASGGLRHEVSSTLLIYMNCDVLERKPYREETLNTWGRLGAPRRVIRRLTPVPTFVPVRGEASPYQSRSFRTGGRPSDYTLAEVADNAILIRDSGANTPYVP